MAWCLHASTHAPQLMHFSLSTINLSFLESAFTGQASTQPTQGPLQEQEVHLACFQQHFL